MTVRCPECGASFVNRAHDEGIADVLWGLLTVYPFRCQLCAARFRAFHGRPTAGSRREYRRVPVCFPLEFQVTAGAPNQAPAGKGVVLDLSIRGCAFNTETSILDGLTLCLKLKPKGSSEAIEVKEAVVRHLRGNRVGVEFLETAPRDRGELRRFVEALMVRQPLHAASS